MASIINERKNHANFQLIIITHDENFLRKLGQGDVMDYYWCAPPNFVLSPDTDTWIYAFHRRVSRDSRQKSIIERQRFG
jgi:DNA repair protein RAD50